MADVAARFGHLVAFALWLGGNVAGLLVPRSDVRRIVPLLWLALAMQMVTGAYQMVSWTPFPVVPYPWRLSLMREFNFGYTYTLILALKLGLAGLAVLATIALTAAVRPNEAVAGRWVRAAQLLALAVGLTLAYAAVTLLLVHEGVDHAL